MKRRTIVSILILYVVNTVMMIVSILCIVRFCVLLINRNASDMFKINYCVKHRFDSYWLQLLLSTIMYLLIHN